MLLIWGLRGACKPEKAKGTGKPRALTRLIHSSGANNIRHECPTAWHWGAADGLLSDLSPQAQGALLVATQGTFFQSSRREQAAAK